MGTIAVEPSILPREHVAQQLSISIATLRRYEERGLVRVVRLGQSEGYGPEEIRRIWTITTYQRDLGINLAGVEVILRLKEQIEMTRDRLDRLAFSLREALGEGGGPDARA